MGNGMDMRSLENCLGDIMRGDNSGNPNINMVGMNPDHLKG